MSKICRSTIPGRSPRGDIPRDKAYVPLHPASNPELKTLNRLYLPVVRAMQIPFPGPDVGMAHRSLNGSEVIPFVQKGSGEGMSHDVRVNPLLDQCPFYLPLPQSSLGPFFRHSRSLKEPR